MKIFILRNDEILENCITWIRANWSKFKRPLVVEMVEESTKRTTIQNKIYWMMLNQVAEKAWVEGRLYPPDVWHEHFKRKFIGEIDMPSGGKMAASTTKLNTREFMEYSTKCEVYAAQELGVQFIEDRYDKN